MGDRLIFAVKKCDAQLVAKAIRRKGTDLEITDTFGSAALHIACKNADIASLLLLLEHKAQHDIFDQDGMTPLHYAVRSKHIELVVALVAFGADVNIRNCATNATPLHYATETDERITKFLFSHGADPDITDQKGQTAQTNLKSLDLHAYSDLRHVLKHTKLWTFGKLLYGHETIKLNEGIVGVEDTDSGSLSEANFLYCRSIPLHYLNLCSGGHNPMLQHINRTDGKVVSDVFEYLTQLNNKEICLRVPLYVKVTRFDRLFLLNINGNKTELDLDNMSVDIKTTFVTARVKLEEPAGHTLGYFVVVMESSVETFKITDETTTINSSKVKRFSVVIPEGFPKSTTVELKVIPSEDGADNRKFVPVEVNTVSNIYDVAVKTAGKQVKDREISVSLPSSSKGRHVRCGITIFRQNTRYDWDIVESEVDDENGTATVPRTKPGRLVLVENEVQLTKLKDKAGKEKQTKVTSQSVLERISKWLQNLYSIVKRKETYLGVKFYAMQKYADSNVCSVLVGFELENQIDSTMNSWQMEEFEADKKTMISSSFHVSNLNRYEVSLKSDTVKMVGADRLPLSVEQEKGGHQLFYVKTDNYKDFVISTIEKRDQHTHNNSSCNILTQFCIRLRGRQHNNAVGGEGGQSGISFPDNQFTETLAREFGHDWLMIGVLLLLRFNSLEELSERNNDASCRNMLILTQTLLRKPNIVDSMDRLVRAFRTTEREDLLAKVDEGINDLKAVSPNHKLCKTLSDRIDRAHAISDDAGKPRDPSILYSKYVPEQPRHAMLDLCGERYVVVLTQILGSRKELLIQLGLQRNVFEEMYHTIKDPKAAMFKSLMRAKQGYRAMTSFLNDTVDALEVLEDNDSATMIRQDMDEANLEAK